MTISRPVRWAAYAGTAAADTIAAASGSRRLRWFTKPALMPLLAVAVGAGAPRGALAGSWAGDVALLSSGDLPLAGGIAGFAAAHVAYLRALRGLRPDRPAERERLAAIGFAATAVAATAAIWPRLADRSALCVPVGAYVALVTAMGHAAVVNGMRRRDTAGLAMAAGGVLFVLSDGLVAFALFGGPHEGTRAVTVEGGVMATYTGAQALLGAR
ncbi:MAG: lysoplasmalogenase [Pseudonocardia sp.]|nr:lysoplasmalogenase [Pseudonocardia sp.]